MGARLKRWRQLTWTERSLLVQIWCVLAVVACGLRWLSLPQLQRLLGLAPVTGSPGAQQSVDGAAALDPYALEEKLTLLDVAARHHVLPIRCLHRALCLQWLLKGQGDVCLRLGVRPSMDGLEAHAWVESRGEPLGEEPGLLERFMALEMNGLA